MDNSLVKKLNKFKEITFVLAVFFLPVSQKINHWLFGAFLVISITLFFVNKSAYQKAKKQRFYIGLVASLFLIKLFGLYHAIDLDTGLKDVIKAIPFLLYPLAILGFDLEYKSFKTLETNIFYALVLGCVTTMIICWGNVFLSLKPDDIPANKFFGWKRSGTHLTKILDIHPPYLGLLLVASIVFLIKELFFITLQKKWKIIYIVTTIALGVFLFNITARNALIFLVLSSVAFLIIQKKWKLLLIPIGAVILLNIVVINHPSEYYRIKLYDMLGITNNSGLKDKRVKRLAASYEVFKTSPIIGVGPGNDDILRVEAYKRAKDQIAVKKRFNSHNQLFEYLVGFGLFGAIIFIVVILFFLMYLIKNKEYFYLLLFCNLIIAMFTESTLERALGIQYFSIICSLALLARFKQPTVLTNSNEKN